MKWIGRRQSGNVEDRRKFGAGSIAVGGGLIGVIILVIRLFMGEDPNRLIQEAQQMQPAQEPQEVVTTAEEDEMAAFVSVVLADNEDVWHSLFKEAGLIYEEPRLVLFRNSVESGCGQAGSSAGPFYCPTDRKVYIDLAFFDELKSRFGAPGDFAVAYVIAHEVGHHIQNLLGTSGKVQELQEMSDEKRGRKLSVALELQADFLAGVWAHHARKMNDILDPGDIEEALGAANAVGDDRLQKQSQGYVVPDAFTHGTSEQRMFWFKRGFESGDMELGNTFENL